MIDDQLLVFGVSLTSLHHEFINPHFSVVGQLHIQKKYYTSTSVLKHFILPLNMSVFPGVPLLCHD